MGNPADTATNVDSKDTLSRQVFIY